MVEVVGLQQQLIIQRPTVERHLEAVEKIGGNDIHIYDIQVVSMLVQLHYTL